MRVGQLGEGVGVAGHRLPALGVELGDAVRLDVLLAGEAELLLDRQLDRQAVAVPAGLAGHVVAAHGAEAREDVLEDAGLDVVGAGHAVRGRAGPRRTPTRGGPRTARGSWRRSCCSRQKSSTACSRAGRSTWAGTWRYCGVRHQRASSGGHVCLPSEGREPCLSVGALPRYHPPWPPARLRAGEPPHWGRDAGSTGPRLSRCGFLPAAPG